MKDATYKKDIAALYEWAIKLEKIMSQVEARAEIMREEYKKAA